MLRLSMVVGLLISIYGQIDALADNATCMVSGFSHYNTFDKQMLTYQGQCKHLLVSSTPNAPQQFEVYVRNERRGLAPVENIQYVEVYFNSFIIRLTKKVVGNTIVLGSYVANGKPSIDITASGFYVFAPITTPNMSVTYTSPFLKLNTTFGLVVLYDGVHIVKVTVPSTYVGKLTGICGNYDQNAANDLITKSGQSVTGYPNAHSKIGDSYVVSDPENMDNSNCTTVDLQPLPTCNPLIKQFYNDTCSQFLNTTGLLKDCISVVGLELAQQYYMNCMYDACSALSYRYICRTFDAFFQLCPSVMTTNLTRSLGCYTLTCTISGDAHYSTFDRQMITYQGTCKHLVINVTSPNVPQFSVYIRNENRSLPLVSYMSYMEFVFGSVTYRIWRKSSTQVDVYKANGVPPHDMKAVGVLMTLPLYDDNIQIAMISGYIQVTTSYGLLAQYDGQQTVRFTVNSFYYGKLQGMCGNPDLNPNNDMITSTGENVQGKVNANSLMGNSFVMSNDPEVQNSSMCMTVDIDPTKQCDPRFKSLFLNTCNQLTNLTGIFTPCHGNMGVLSAQYASNCYYDACATSYYSSICSTFDSYLQVCGVDVKNWRQAYGCGQGVTTGTPGFSGTPTETTSTPLPHH